MEDERFKIDTETPDRAEAWRRLFVRAILGFPILVIIFQTMVIYWMSGMMITQARQAAQLARCLDLAAGRVDFELREDDQDCGFKSYRVFCRFEGEPVNALLSIRSESDASISVFAPERGMWVAVADERLWQFINESAKLNGIIR